MKEVVRAGKEERGLIWRVQVVKCAESKKVFFKDYEDEI